MKLKVAIFINFLLVALYAGLRFGSMMYYSPGLDALPGSVFVQAQNSIEHAFSASIIVFAGLTVLTALPVLWYLRQARVPKVVKVLFGMAFVCLVAQLLSTGLVNVGINHQVSSWTATNFPSNWRDIRGHWDVFDRFRGAMMISALVLELVAILKLVTAGSPSSSRSK